MLRPRRSDAVLSISDGGPLRETKFPFLERFWRSETRVPCFCSHEPRLPSMSCRCGCCTFVNALTHISRRLADHVPPPQIQRRDVATTFSETGRIPTKPRVLPSAFGPTWKLVGQATHGSQEGGAVRGPAEVSRQHCRVRMGGRRQVATAVREAGRVPSKPRALPFG